MNHKFDLKRMIEEIREDQAAEDAKHRKLTQEGVRKRVARRRARGSISRER